MKLHLWLKSYSKKKSNVAICYQFPPSTCIFIPCFVRPGKSSESSPQSILVHGPTTNPSLHIYRFDVVRRLDEARWPAYTLGFEWSSALCVTYDPLRKQPWGLSYHRRSSAKLTPGALSRDSWPLPFPTPRGHRRGASSLESGSFFTSGPGQPPATSSLSFYPAFRWYNSGRKKGWNWNWETKKLREFRGRFISSRVSTRYSGKERNWGKFLNEVEKLKISLISFEDILREEHGRYYRTKVVFG